MNNLEHTLRVFNENKLYILQVLYKCPDEFCGCDLIEKLDIPKNLLSHHLKGLKELGYVEETKCGRKKFYRLVKASKAKVKKILEITELI